MIIWVVYYIIPDILGSLLYSLLGKGILFLIVILSSLYNIKYGIISITGILLLYRITNIHSDTKEGFVWKKETVQKFLELESLINTGIVFDPVIVQQQASEKEVTYFLKNKSWPWSKKVEKIYKDAVAINPYIRTSVEDSLKYAKTIYNEKAILELLSLQTNEGRLLIDGVLKKVPNNPEQPPYAYNSGLISKYNSIIRCDTKNTNNPIMVEEIRPPLGSLNDPEITYLDNNDLENKIPGFKFVNYPCNPCLALKQIPDYTCPFSIKTKNHPTGEISNVWQYLWNLNPIKSLSISKTIESSNNKI
jgi:hypothetical protein